MACCGGQRTLGYQPLAFISLEEESLLFATVWVFQTSWPVSFWGNSLVSAPSLTPGLLELQICVTCLAFMWVLVIWTQFQAGDHQFFYLLSHFSSFRCSVLQANATVLGVVRPLIYANQMILLFYKCNSYFDCWWSWGGVCLIKNCHEWVSGMIDRFELYKPFLTVHVPSHDASGFNQTHARSMHRLKM